MTIDLNVLKASIDATPMGMAVTALLSQGKPVNHIVTDADTGESYTSHNGGPFERSHAWVEAIVNGTEYRDPGELNPLIKRTAACSPTAKRQHDARVLSMLEYLITYYRRDLTNHVGFNRTCRELVAHLTDAHIRQKLKACATNYDRWDLLIEHVVSSLDPNV